jgi:hypothetical protein
LGLSDVVEDQTTWIFQGNPDKFDIDQYLLDNKFIWWSLRQIGLDFIEGHHTIPISETAGEYHAKVEDIALVCSNCHRMLHRRRPWLKMQELKQLMRNQL